MGIKPARINEAVMILGLTREQLHFSIYTPNDYPGNVEMVEDIEK